MAKQKTTFQVEGQEISITTIQEEDYISLTDMVRTRRNPSQIINNWLRNKDTLAFLAVWEKINNPDFKLLEFEKFQEEAGFNAFTISAKEWINKTHAIGLISKPGRYGGSFAHRDIAFSFGAWISPTFQYYLIREFQRLKEQEAALLNKTWDYSRFLSKINYTIQNESIKAHILPRLELPKNRTGIVYATEADLLNMAVFGMTAKQWREQNPKLVKAGKNLRDIASIQELTVLANLESFNAQLIENGASKEARLEALSKMARTQLNILNEDPRLLGWDGNERNLPST